MLPQLFIWDDQEPRNGPANMAVDELLWENIQVPTLRIYRWLGDWVSLGYFSHFASVAAWEPDYSGQIVRRWTGGGIVDHRHDWTYSLIIPRGYALAEMPAAQSYSVVHAALAEVMRAEGIDATLSESDAVHKSAYCFQKPVQHDVVTRAGGKIAGAGQRRGRAGFLHQGSVSVCPQDSLQRAHQLATMLADQVCFEPILPDFSEISHRIMVRYGSPAWTEKR